MTVRYTHEKRCPDTGSFLGWGFVMWDGGFAVGRGNRREPAAFPVTHPVSPGAFACKHTKKAPQVGCSKELETFRARGYWASCLPEGTGIAVRCLNGQDAVRVSLDLVEVFGFDVKVCEREG
jgi:hypothetical protein